MNSEKKIKQAIRSKRYYERIKADPVLYEKRKERCRIHGIKYLRKNKDKLAASCKSWRSTEAGKEVLRNWQKNKIKNDPNFHMRKRISNRVRGLLSGKVKNSSSLDLLGCSAPELLKHIESLFVDGMSWDNRSLWHIDHIRPCSSFDLTDVNQQKCCFHFSNLQPLWAMDNMIKSDKYEAK